MPLLEMQKKGHHEKCSLLVFYLIKDIHYEETIKLMHALIEVLNDHHDI